ncbi:hypothetical protein J6590_069869 [Homalodisca vitripennis]|nr:hypothetical protein J6590_069869 [Homalodisca vitripennis]
MWVGKVGIPNLFSDEKKETRPLENWGSTLYPWLHPSRLLRPSAVFRTRRFPLGRQTVQGLSLGKPPALRTPSYKCPRV